jgi:hypothetical protein
LSRCRTIVVRYRSRIDGVTLVIVAAVSVLFVGAIIVVRAVLRLSHLSQPRRLGPDVLAATTTATRAGSTGPPLAAALRVLHVCTLACPGAVQCLAVRLRRHTEVCRVRVSARQVLDADRCRRLRFLLAVDATPTGARLHSHCESGRRRLLHVAAVYGWRAAADDGRRRSGCLAASAGVV